MENTFERVYEQVAEANQGFIQHAIRLEQLVTRTQSALVEQHIAFVESCLDTGAKQLQALAEARDPRDLLSRQAELATQLGERVVALVQHVVDIQGEAREEMTGLVRENLKASEPKAVAKPAARGAKPAAKSAKEAKGPQAAA